MSAHEYPIPDKESLTLEYKEKQHKFFEAALLNPENKIRKFELFQDHIIACLPIQETEYYSAVYRIDNHLYLFEKCLIVPPVVYVLVSDVSVYSNTPEGSVFDALSAAKEAAIKSLATLPPLDNRAKAAGQRLVLGMLKYLDPDLFEEVMDAAFGDILPAYIKSLKMLVVKVPVEISDEPVRKLTVRKYKRRRRGEAAAIVAKYRKDFPSGTISDCVKTAGVSRNTVKKHWNDSAEDS